MFRLWPDRLRQRPQTPADMQTAHQAADAMTPGDGPARPDVPAEAPCMARMTELPGTRLVRPAGDAHVGNVRNEFIREIT